MAIKPTLVTDSSVIKALYGKVASLNKDDLIAFLMVRTQFLNPNGGFLTWDDLLGANEAFLYSVLMEYSNRIGTVSSSIFGVVTNPEQKVLTAEADAIMYLLYTKVHARLNKAEMARKREELQHKLKVLQEVDAQHQTETLKALSADERAKAIAELQAELNPV
jgi:hypothetical protein